MKKMVFLSVFLFMFNVSVVKCLDTLSINDLKVGDYVDSSTLITNDITSDKVLFYDENGSKSEVVVDDEGFYSIKAVDEHEGWYVNSIEDNEIVLIPYTEDIVNQNVSEEIEDPFLSAPNPNTIDKIYFIIACSLAVVFSLVYSVIKVNRIRRYDI